MRTWMIASGAIVLLACTDEPDVVGYPLALEAGPAVDAATDAAIEASVDDFCDPENRFRRARLPSVLVFNLYRMECKIPLQDFRPRDGEIPLTASEFAMLSNAPAIMPKPGTPASLLCDPTRGGYYFEPWDDPQRLVLCPATCELVKNEIERVLALDGCDPSFDDAGTP